MDIVVFISGKGSNLQAIINYINKNNLKINIKAVISNNPDAYGLTIAEHHHIKNYLVEYNKNTSIFSQSLLEIIRPLNPNLIILAGFMKILPQEFIQHFENKILNIHPSLLPKYPGLHTHKKALANQDQEHGSTVHYVTKDLDSGPIIKQAKLQINPDDTVESLTKRVQQLEYQLYPQVIEEFYHQLCPAHQLTL